MADTSAQRRAAQWVIEEWLPKKFDAEFRIEPVALSSGGQYKFDAVSKDGTIVVAISTSAATTSSGKTAIGKMNKIRSDMFFLLLTKARRRVLILTEEDMYNRCLAEKDRGRVPEQIEFLHVNLPVHIKKSVLESRERASEEVRPK